jgi:hypothetical protein
LLLSKSQILAARDHQVEKVDVPEWGGFVFVRVMTAGERDQFERKFTQDRYGNIRAYVAAATVCDDEGNLLFEKADIDVLATKSGAAVDRLFDVALRINKLRKKDIDELEKNSKANPSEDSSSVCLS